MSVDFAGVLIDRPLLWSSIILANKNEGVYQGL